MKSDDYLVKGWKSAVCMLKSQAIIDWGINSNHYGTGK